MKHACLLVFLCAAACSGGMSHAAIDAPRPAPPALRVAGEYETAVTLSQSTCQGITVRPMPTSVSHAPGATDLTLSHAGQTYAGTIERDGRFVTAPRSVGSPADLHTLTIGGRFSTTGFEATVTAAVSHDGVHDCDYVVGWVGTKNGEPNVIP